MSLIRIRRSLLCCSALVFSILGVAADQPAKPNILVILTDDQGRADYSAYGTGDLQTPNIDSLFRAGMRFESFYANCPVCSPTRAALMTGRYPDRVGVPGVIRTHDSDSWGFLSPEAPLLSEVLRQAGYHTALVGKWHLGLRSPNTPPERGFDFFRGFLGDMMDDYWNHRRHGINYMRHDRQEIDPEGHATDLFSDWACDYLRSRIGQENPFFLYLAYNAPHTPIQPPEDWVRRVRRRSPDLNEKRLRLVAFIEHLDAGIGRVLGTLEQTGLEDNTLVVFTSDNGGQLAVGANNGPWRSGKQHVYEGGLRVPFAVRWPGRIRAGAQCEWTALTMDLYPTLLAAAGTEAASDIDGINLLPAWLGSGGSPPARDVYFVRREGGNAYGGKTIEALRRGDWKILQDSPFAPLELYHLGDDPGETTNLAAENRQVFNQLSAALRKQIQAGGRVPWQAR